MIKRKVAVKVLKKRYLHTCNYLFVDKETQVVFSDEWNDLRTGLVASFGEIYSATELEVKRQLNVGAQTACVRLVIEF